MLLSRLRRIWDWVKFMWYDSDSDPRSVYYVLRKKLVRMQDEMGYNRYISILINLIDRHDLDYYLLEPFAHIHVTASVSGENKLDFSYSNDDLDKYFEKYHHTPKGLYSGDRFDEAAIIAIRNHEKAHKLLARILYEKLDKWGV